MDECLERFGRGCEFIEGEFLKSFDQVVSGVRVIKMVRSKSGVGYARKAK